MAGGKKKNEQLFYSFESKKDRGRFVRLAEDMMDSPAWKSLKLAQRGLYTELKKKFSKRSNGTTTQNDISMPKSEAESLYGDLRTFRSNMDALISHGFLKCVRSGFNTREVSIYGFSERWKDYGTPGFAIPKDELRPHVGKLAPRSDAFDN